MKKLRIGSVLLLLISTVIFMVFKIYERTISDFEPPVISFQEEELTVSANADESELLKDVKAVDKRSGDVSKALVVESLSGFTEDGTRMITYAAIDKNGNVARKERVLHYSDYQAPHFSLSAPLRFPRGKNVNVLSRVTAESVLDGNLTDKIKYSLEQMVDVTTPEKYPVEFRVMDSGGNTVYLKTGLEVYNPMAEQIDVSLNQYIVYLDVNAAFNPADYYVGASEAGTLEVQSHVDMAVPGVYDVDYIVHGEHTIGKSRLIVVVNAG